MALTPEDVVNKRFNPTKFREGYDQDEVDDFLDEVVVELRRLNQENEELRQRLVAGDARINELQHAALTAPAAAPIAAPVAAPEPVFAPAAVEATPAEADPGNTNNLLQLARRLHEEHVREGMEKRDALIAEGHAAAARVVSEAEQAGQAKLAEAEQASQNRLAEAEQASQSRLAEVEQAGRSQLGQLEQEKINLERQVEQLREFEREYRVKLKGYIEGQLRELETSNALTTGSTPAAVAATAAPAPAEAQPAVEQYAVAAPQAAAPQAAAPAPAYSGPQPSDSGAYPQPTDYPGFAAGN